MGRDKSHGSSCGGGHSSLDYLLGSPVKSPPPTASTADGEAPLALDLKVVENVGTMYTDAEVSKLTLKDLRMELRARGYNPAGGHVALVERLIEAIAAQKASGDEAAPISIMAELSPAAAPESGKMPAAGVNNYSRPEGQNVDNFITDRSSSRVLAPPGGVSTVSFG